MKTAKRLGIKTVAVFSDADRGALFTKLADEAIPIVRNRIPTTLHPYSCLKKGGQKTSESYLRADKILAVAKAAKVDAIHPGYGFLSENRYIV